MVFSSLTFLFIFLPLVLVIYYCSPRKVRNLILFIASLLFYAWGEPIYVLVMIFSIIFNYTIGLLIAKKKNEKILLISSIVVNLGMLGFFKYSNFFITNLNNVFDLNIDLLKVALPIGISFYTFQTMSYVIDVYLGTVKVQKNIIDFGAYVTFFPQLIAGPIVKYRDIEKELKDRKENIDDFAYGIKRFIIGLFKKIILANNIGLVWTQISGGNLNNLAVLEAWLGAICFTFQIYFDFSGYSDMAIGLGKMFGFHFPENFEHPYESKSITEFWRRWHISLSTWFREYVYFPLGGSRKGVKKQIRNLLIVWMLTGFWHGANWNFILWGLYFGILLIIEKFVISKYLEKMPKILQHIYTMFFVIISWVIFAFDDISKVGMYLKAMFGIEACGLINSEFIYLISTHLLLIIICTISSTTIFKKIYTYLKNKMSWIEIPENIIYILGLFVSVCFLIGSTYNPFLYFRF